MNNCGEINNMHFRAQHKLLNLMVQLASDIICMYTSFNGPKYIFSGGRAGGGLAWGLKVS